MKKYNFIIIGLFLSLNLLAQNLYLGNELKRERRYYSSNGQYNLVFQNDGNLVLYGYGKEVKWSSKTENRGERAIFQRDGNLVIYDYSGKAIFSTKTNDKGAYKLHIDNNAKIVILGRGDNILWQSNPLGGNDSNNNWGGSGGSWGSNDNDKVFKGYIFSKNNKLHSVNREYHLVFQEDGNLVVYDKDKNVYWASNTQNRGARAEFQRDGNLVVYDYSRRSVFASNSNNKGGNTLRMQDDGNLVIYDRYNKPIWASKK